MGTVTQIPNTELLSHHKGSTWNLLFCFKLNKLFLNKIDAEDPEVSDYTMIPDTNRLSELPRVCLQESEEIPPDYTRLFNTRLFSIGTTAVPRGINAYKELGIKHEPLRLITPQFE